MLKRLRSAIGAAVEPVFPDSIGGWRDPSNVRKVWLLVRDELGMGGVTSRTRRKAVATFLDDANTSARKISNQLGHSNIRITQGPLPRPQVDRPGDGRRSENLLAPESKEAKRTHKDLCS